jgi:predicted DNA-binding transcriptional regulator AlpA
MPTKPKKYLTVEHLCDRWGDRSRMSVERLLRTDPNFPKPMRLGGKGRVRLFDEEKIEAYERRFIVEGPDAA